MNLEPGISRAHPLLADAWIGSEPLTREALAGSPWLVHFFSTASLDALDALPAVEGWARRYGPAGLRVIGVHAPDFAFQKSAEHVRAEVARLGVGYPVAVDSSLETWHGWGVRSSPARHLVSADGWLVHFHAGRGGEAETEAAIRRVLPATTFDSSASSPASALVQRPSAVDLATPRASEIATTSEVHCGYARGRLGPPQAFAVDSEMRFDLPDERRPDFLYLGGEWTTFSDRAEHRTDRPAHIVVRYTGSRAACVLAPLAGPVRVSVVQDGAPLGVHDAGPDLRFEPDGRSYIEVDAPRLYRVVENLARSRRELRLVTRAPVAAYALQFS